jgi:glycosyltransferase involved in cell wall biosynthesis
VAAAPAAAPSGAPILHVGAAETLSGVAFQQLLALRERGWNVQVACGEDAWSGKLEEAGLELHAIDLPHHASPREALRGGADLRQVFKRLHPAIVHTHNAHHGAMGRVAARMAGIPAVHTWRYSPFDAADSKLKHAAFWGIEATASRAGRAVLFQNREDLGSAVDSHLVPAAHAVYIANGITVERYREPGRPPEEVRRELGVAPDGQLVTCVARLHTRKGQPYLLQALATLASDYPDLRLLLVGEGPEEAEVRAEIARLGLGERVLMEGHRSDVADLLHASDVVCLPSRREGFPRVVLEAMAAGRAVLATDVVGTREAVVPEETGILVPFADPGALAAGLRRLLSSPELRQQLGENARAALDRNGWREGDVADRVALVYGNVLAGRVAGDGVWPGGRS